MKFSRLTAPAVAASLALGVVAAPKADAFETVYDKATDKCTITFTDTDTERVNDAYEGLFLRMGEQVRDGFTGDKAKADAQIVWEYGIREDVKSAADLPLPADLTISNAQTRLALGDQKDRYWQTIGFINASKKPVITEQAIVMTPEEARTDGGVTYGVDLGSLAGGAIGGLIFGGEFADLRDAILDAATTYAPEFAASIASYGKAFEACEERENLSSSVMPGSSLTSSQATGIGIAGLVAGILALVGAGFALRPFVDQFMAQLPR